MIESRALGRGVLKWEVGDRTGHFGGWRRQHTPVGKQGSGLKWWHRENEVGRRKEVR